MISVSAELMIYQRNDITLRAVIYLLYIMERILYRHLDKPLNTGH